MTSEHLAGKSLIALYWLALSVCAQSNARADNSGATVNWAVYGGNEAAQRYSPLKQINRGNVAKLKLVWRFDADEPGDPETNPLIVDGVLYAYTPSLKVVALDATTGKERWRYDPGVETGMPSRGFAYWSNGKQQRLFAGVMNYLIALDPATGKPDAAFGEQGRIDLRQGLYGDYLRHFVAVTSPGVIYHNLIIVGFRTLETHPAAPGDVRAFDVRTGELRWAFHTIPRPGEPGYESWPADAWKSAGAANNWAGMSLDVTRGIVFVPTGSAVSDFYGADRLGDDLYADTLLALDAGTGRRLWHFQDVHHDILDRDLPTAPSLLTVHRHGHSTDVVAQPTKQGFLYVFDRVSGKPVFPVAEREAPRSEVPGEVASATQPFVSIPEPYARQTLSEAQLTDRSSSAHDFAVAEFQHMRSEGPFTPAGIDRPSVVFPGFDGGAEWGGAAVNPKTGVLYINSNDVAWSAQLTDKVADGGMIAQTYQASCASCHGPDRRGSPPTFPSLVDADKRIPRRDLEQVVQSGRGRMPAFKELRGNELDALVSFISTGIEPVENKSKEMSYPLGVQDAGVPYHFTGYKKFLDPDGYPAIKPPWGTLNAIDLNTGRYLWKIPLGEYPELAARGLAGTGTENYGGPIVTAGGLVFIGATIFDRRMHVFDADTGRLLWDFELPYAGTATPATYMVNGKQYVVIATNNARNRRAPQGCAYVAFALP